MPRQTQLRTALACALAVGLTLALVPAAGAMTATLRVVGTGNAVLAEKPIKSFNLAVKTSPKATCLGAGTGGSGKAVRLRGDTALGLLADGAKTTKRLAPLALTDHFSFGLGLCGVGKSVAKGESSWYLKINHKGASVGGEKAKVGNGDEVLWDLAATYPYPDELVLKAPRRARAGKSFAVHVYAYDEKGHRAPAAGARVTGAGAPTDAQGRAVVTLRKPTRLVAKLGQDIPSAAVPVCLGKKCPAGHR